MNLLVVDTNDADGYILVKGAVPGADGSVVFIKDAMKRPLHKDAPLPAGLKKNSKAEAPAPEAPAASEEQKEQS